MALRETIDAYHHNGAKIALGIDTGGPVGGDHVVSIASGNWRSDSDDGGWFVNRWFFFNEWNEQYARNFAEKIATDEEYRSRSLAGDATWRRVEDAYEKASREVYGEFQSRNLLSYTAGNSDEKRVSRNATREMESICESLFYGLKQRLRDPGGVDESEPVDIEEFKRVILDDARTKADNIIHL